MRVSLPKRNTEDVMGLSVGSFAEDEACSWIKSTVRQWRDDHAGVLELVRYVGCLPLALGLVSAAQRWAVELSEGGRKSVRAPNLAVLGRDDCPPSLHAVVMLSRGKIRQESGDGEAAEAALRKMSLLDTMAIPLDLLSSTERKAVLVLKQHALVTVDEKDLVAIHSLTQLAVRGQTDKGDRRAIAECVARALKERLAKFDHQKATSSEVEAADGGRGGGVAAVMTRKGVSGRLVRVMVSVRLRRRIRYWRRKVRVTGRLVVALM
jgi:hypothetical protein